MIDCLVIGEVKVSQEETLHDVEKSSSRDTPTIAIYRKERNMNFSRLALVGYKYLASSPMSVRVPSDPM